MLGLPLCKLLGMARDRVPVYGSGGFTAYSIERLAEQLGGWVERGDSASQDEGRVRAGRGPGARARGARGDRARDRAVRRCQRRLLAQAGARPRGALPRRRRRELVRGAGVLRRPRRPAAPARPRAGRDGDRRRRVRLRRGLLPADARGRGGRRAPGRRHPMRRDHRAAARGRAVPRPRGAAVAPLRPVDPPAPGDRARELRPPRVLPRPRADRAHAVRRRGDPVDGAIAPDLDRPGIGLELKRGEAERYAA